jgi:hypothetical protein
LKDFSLDGGDCIRDHVSSPGVNVVGPHSRSIPWTVL